MASPKKIYLAGKVTGLPRVTATMLFGTVQKRLMDQGYEVIVPLDIVPNNTSWEQAMKICIAALIQCDEVHLLPNWIDSKGAILEQQIAHSLSIPMVYHQ
jgi:hypothetical protein